jgi:hypothetical protein
MHLVAQNHHPSPPSAASYFSRRASSSSSTSTSASSRRPAPPRRHRKTTHSSSAAAGAGSRKALAARAELARHIKQVKAERDGAHRGENRGDLLDDLVDEEVDPLAPEPPDVLYKRRERLWQQLLWMSRRGKGKETMHATVRKENLLRQWFAYLDADASQRISVDELEDPLISVGLAHSRRSVENLIRSVDKSSGGEGEITFDEFKELLHKNRETLYDDEGESGSKDPLQRLVAKPARRVRRASAAYGDSGSSGGGVGSGVGGGGKGGAFGVLPSSGSRGRSASGHWGEVAQIVKQRREKKYGGGTSGNNQKKMGGGVAVVATVVAMVVVVVVLVDSLVVAAVAVSGAAQAANNSRRPTSRLRPNLRRVETATPATSRMCPWATAATRRPSCGSSRPSSRVDSGTTPTSPCLCSSGPTGASYSCRPT